MTWVIDASVAVEILLRTAMGEHAWGMIHDGDLVAPDLLDAEVLSVLRRENLAGRLGEPRAREALDDLAAWGIERVPCVLLLSEAWTFRANASAYDALYLALAVRRNAGVITADGPLARAPIKGVTIHNIRG